MKYIVAIFSMVFAAYVVGYEVGRKDGLNSTRQSFKVIIP